MSKRKFTDEEEKQICKEYLSKEMPSTVTLGKKWGCSDLTISCIIVRNGYILRTHGEARRGKDFLSKRKFIKEEELQICTEYFSKEKPSTTILAKKWGCTEPTIRNIIIRNGYKLRTNSEALKGKFIGEKHPMFGKHPTAWNKDIQTGPLSEKTKQKMSKSHEGKIGYWRGKHPSENHKKKTSKTMKSNYHYLRGNHLPEETKRKSSISHLGQKAWNKNIPCSEETKQKLREKAILQHQNHLGPYKDTKPELKMKKILNELNIKFEHQFRLEHCLFDFYILNSNVLIEVDGDYYHGNPKKFIKLNKMQLKMKERDIKHNEVAEENDFILLRFWEDDILNNTDIVKNEIRKIVYEEKYIN